MLYMSIIVLIPLAAVAVKAFSQSPSEFWQSITNKTSLTALAVTLGSSLVVAAIGAVMGTWSRGCSSATSSPASASSAR